jgi:uncharacterized membrane protein
MIDFTHLHPMIVHFPIALLIIGFLTDLASLFMKQDFWKQAGLYLLILGAAGTIAALISGEQAGSGIAEQGLLKQAIEQHEEAAILAVWLISVTTVIRIALVLLKKYTGAFKIAALILFFLSVGAIARTGYYGGKLVYEHAAGVEFNLGFNLNSTSSNDIDD